MRKAIFLALLLMAFIVYRSDGLDFFRRLPTDPASPGKWGVSPDARGGCPQTHPIKGNFTTYSGEPCIYHVPGGTFYAKTWAERCYASEDEARKGRCRASRR